MSSIEHCMSGVAEHHEARRKEAFKQKQAKARQQLEKLQAERERQRQIDESLYGEQTKQQTAQAADSERRQTKNPEDRWYSAKIPQRYSSFDYTSQW